MLKKEIISTIMTHLEVVDVWLVRVYGVPMGIGYDMVAEVKAKETGEILHFDFHAGPQSWDCIGHLRPNQLGFDAYKGGNPPLLYLDRVKRWWSEKAGFRFYLERFKKKELEEMLQDLQG